MKPSRPSKNPSWCSRVCKIVPFIKLNSVVAKVLRHRDPSWRPGARREPERIVLPPAADVRPSGKPSVRIFMGTEPSQYRPERIFVWSIEQVRDPARFYEIYLMKELTRFDRSRWTTGFTNYRFAIPHFTQGHGRAIYNDVDQIYLSDPAELFDLEMGDHGFLAISDTESSVMLIDCARMAKVWTLEDARRLSKKRLLAKALAVPRLRGDLSPDWNARDEEYHPGRSKLLHFTTLHTQPWQPSPEKYVYEEHPHGSLWGSLERSADAARAHVFTRSQPSARYRLRRSLYQQMQDRDAVARATPDGTAMRSPEATWSEHREAIRTLVAGSRARGLLLYGSAARSGLGGSRDAFSAKPWREDLRLTFYDPVRQSYSEPPSSAFDGVVCLDELDRTPEDDIPWVLDELFGQARHFVYASISCHARPSRLPNGELEPYTAKDTDWWRAQFESAAQRFPDVHWELATERPSAEKKATLWWAWGGRFLGAEKPSVWVLIEDRTGNNAQSLGLAEALGWPYELKTIQFSVAARLPNRLLGTSLFGVNRARSAALTPPWPHLVIATGRRLAPVAKWIRHQSRGRTRLIHLGRKGGQVADSFDLMVACAHFRLPPHPRRVETVAPLNPVTPERLKQAAERWPNLFGNAPRPHVALLVGGSSHLCRLDVAVAERLGKEVRAFAEAAGGSVHAVTSRRTGFKVAEVLGRALGPSAFVHRWRPGQQESPYLGYLATADVLVVTGESETMLAETAACGRPVYICPLPQRPLGLSGRLRAWLAARAQARPVNNRGTARPQQGLEYLCARIITRGFILPPRDLHALHQTLIRLGVARPFGEPLEVGPRPVLSEAEEVAHRVRALLGVHPRDRAEPLTPAAESVTAKVQR